MKKVVHIGMDVGSTTVKIAVMNEELEIIETSYERHYSDTKNTVCKVLQDLAERYKENEFTIALTGSGAMSTAKFLDVPFIQEVVACKRAVEKYIPQTDVVIELGELIVEPQENNNAPKTNMVKFKAKLFFIFSPFFVLKRQNR